MISSTKNNCVDESIGTLIIGAGIVLSGTALVQAAIDKVARADRKVG